MAKQALFFSFEIPDIQDQKDREEEKRRELKVPTLCLIMHRGVACLWVLAFRFSLFASYIQNAAHTAPISHKLTIDGPFGKIIIYALL
jgi:hypothetical protein